MAASKCKADHSTDPQPSGVPSQQNSKSLGTLPFSIPGFNPAQLSLGPENNLAVQGKQLELLQMLWQQVKLQDGNFPTTDSTVQPRSYDKDGYSVVISNGTLCYANKERGIVMMETGTPFHIAIANNNDFGELNAHVDINFPNTYFQNTIVMKS